LQGRYHRQRHSLRHVTFIFVAALSLLATSALPAVAQDGTPAGVAAPTEIATGAATEAPTETATEVATEAPATETATAIATETVTAVATEAPVAALSYAPAAQPWCELAPDQPVAIASGGSIDYLCTDSVHLSGTSVVPASIAITWSSWVAVAGGWSVQMLPPVNPGDPDPVWTAPGLAEAWFEFRQVNPIGAGAEPVAIDQTVSIQYRLRLTRATCAVEPQTLTLDRSIAVGSTDPAAVITANPVGTEPRYLTPELAPIPEPSVAFDGLLAFGEIAVTADGPETSTAPGAVSMTVANLDQSCGNWMLNLAATPLTGGDGAPLDGSQLLAVSINGESLPEPCDLATGCDLASLATGPEAAPTQNITIGVQLRLPESPDIGSFDTSLTAALQPAAAD
jgi:hypothetical protein